MSNPTVDARRYRVLCVCTANICRSPLAAGVLRAALAARGLGARWQVASAGIHALVGQPAAALSIECAAAYGADLSAHVARAFELADFACFDHLVAMDRSHLDFLCNVRPPHWHGRIALLRAGAARAPVEIDDPYGGARRAYQHAAALIADGVDNLIGDWLEREGAAG